jgi:hypothetical protein
MAKHVPSLLAFLFLSAATARAAIPSTELYPFPGYDLDLVRAKTRAESGSDSGDLAESWRLYRAVQGSWMPKAPKPEAQTLAQLDALKVKLEAIPLPSWFADALRAPPVVRIDLAERIGDPTFERQRASPEYQALKALAIVHLCEHELDRPGAAQEAGRYLSALAITHPWDWQVHGLFSRFLIDAQEYGPAWNEANLGLFLNPGPNLHDLKFYTFVGSITAKQEWTKIMVAVRESVKDDGLAETAIRESEVLFSANTKVSTLPSK